MADVKIVDIDNVQWNMKDQVARDKITELEAKTTNLPIGAVSYHQKITTNNWILSKDGMYYFEEKTYNELLPAGTKPISITLGNWNNMNAYIIIPYLGTDKIGFLSNSNNARVQDLLVYVTYIKA
jgi:hypothetical protein